MSICDELSNLYQETKVKIDALKLELDLEMQKEKTERDYSRVKNLKEKIEEGLKELDYEINLIPELLRGKEGVRVERLKIGGKTKEQLIQEMKERDIYISNISMDILNSNEFTVSSKPESINLIHLKVGDLGLPEDKNPTTDEIYKRIKELGLELCPAEVGLNYRLEYADQPMGESIAIGMKQIRGRGGGPFVFTVKRGRDGLSLDGGWANPAMSWELEYKVVFCTRPPMYKATGG